MGRQGPAQGHAAVSPCLQLPLRARICGLPPLVGLPQSCGAELTAPTAPTRSLGRVRCSAQRPAADVSAPRTQKAWVSVPRSSSWPGLTLPGCSRKLFEGQETKRQPGILGWRSGWPPGLLRGWRGVRRVLWAPLWVGEGRVPSLRSVPTQRAGLRQAVCRLSSRPKLRALAGTALGSRAGPAPLPHQGRVPWGRSAGQEHPPVPSRPATAVTLSR